jgi:hypothetical protein
MNKRDRQPPEDLPPAESARVSRRDRDAQAGARAGMGTGLAKQFKQVLDAQVKRAHDAAPKPKPKPKRVAGPADRGRPPTSS